MKRLWIIAPQPDDELLGLAGCFFALQRAGWKITVIVVSLNSGGDRVRRKQELCESCRRTGFELHILDRAISKNDDHIEAERRLTEDLIEYARHCPPDLVASPSLHDSHHGHETTARSLRNALEHIPQVKNWLIWAWWGSIPFQSFYRPLEETELQQILHALEAYKGETARNPYGRALVARAELTAILAPEQVWEYGSASLQDRMAESGLELVRTDKGWCLGESVNWKMGETPLTDASRAKQSMQWWLQSPSPRDKVRFADST